MWIVANICSGELHEKIGSALFQSAEMKDALPCVTWPTKVQDVIPFAKDEGWAVVSIRGIRIRFIRLFPKKDKKVVEEKLTRFSQASGEDWEPSVSSLGSAAVIVSGGK